MAFPSRQLTPDLCLRLPRPEDTGALYRLVNAERRELERWLDWPRRIQRENDARQLIQEMRLFNRGGQKLFTFIFRENELGGSLALLRIDPQNRSAEMGYWKAGRVLRRPDMLRAGRCLVNHCLHTLALHRLEIRCAAENIPAARLATELGFREEGRLRDAWRYGDRYHDLLIFGKVLREDR